MIMLEVYFVEISLELVHWFRRYSRLTLLNLVEIPCICPENENYEKMSPLEDDY